MNTDDDHDWLAGLTGRSSTGSPDAADAEGRALRQALLRTREQTVRAAAAPSTAAAVQIDPGRERVLLERAEREGLIESRRLRSAPGWRPLLATAALAILGFGLVWMLRVPGDTEVLRGSADGVVRLEARDPAGLQRRILTDLQTAGVAATAYEALDVQGIDADLPQPLPPAVAHVLESHGIPPPADGVLRIEIRQPE